MLIANSIRQGRLKNFDNFDHPETLFLSYFGISVILFKYVILSISVECQIFLNKK
jgi:hypothetical protein